MFKEMNKKDIATTRVLPEKMLLKLTETENVAIEESEDT
jgi:hypothetical protein